VLRAFAREQNATCAPAVAVNASVGVWQCGPAIPAELNTTQPQIHYPFAQLRQPAQPVHAQRVLPGEQVHHRRGVCHPQHTGARALVGRGGERCSGGGEWRRLRLQRVGDALLRLCSVRIVKQLNAPHPRPTTRVHPPRWTARPSRRRSGTLRGRSGTAPLPALTTGGRWGRCWCTTSPSRVGGRGLGLLGRGCSRWLVGEAVGR